MTSKISWLEYKDKWEKLKSIGVEKKTIESIQTGEVIEENRYFIISFKDDIHSFADAVRKHWGVENNLHAPLDIVFKEDANRTLEKNGARNLGILKRICLAVLKFVQTYYNLSLNKIRFLLSIDFEKEIENKEKKETDITQFISNVKKYTEIDELTPEILNELIEKIIIHQTEKINGKKVQEIDIYYKGIGIISFPVSINDIEVTIEKILNKKTA